MDLDNFTCKLPIVGSDSLCIVNSEVTGSNVCILLLHENQSWSGKFQVENNEDAADLIDQLSLTEDKYIDETKYALRTHGGADNFSYSLENDKFTWKKCVGKNMAVKFGFISLEKVPLFQTFEEIADKSFQTNAKLSSELQSLAKQKEMLEEENSLLKSKLNDLIEKKKEMDSTLYSQFLYLLNEKKKRIRELQKKVDPSAEDDEGDSDPFGTDTDLDSDEEEKSHKLECDGSLDVGDEIINSSLKRLKTTIKVKSKAGSIGCGREGKNNKKTTKCEPKTVVTSLLKKSSESKRTSKKSEKYSCTLASITSEETKSNSEEEAFMFPKRSRKIDNGVKLVKPSTSKMKYDSDEDETKDSDQKIDIDSDNTPSEIDPVETVGKTVVDSLKATNLCSSETDDRRSRNFEVCAGRDQNHIKSEQSRAVQETFKEFSSSTLDILNQLV